MQQILREDLQKWKLCAWYVPHTLTAEYKKQCLNNAYDLIETIKSDPNFLTLLLVTRAGVLYMTQEQSAKVPNGVVRTRHILQKVFISKTKGKDDADFVF